MKFEKTEVWGFEHAIRGMRNPKESWSLTDSEKGALCIHCFENNGKCLKSCLGKKDLELMQKLIKAGSEHRKFMRQIFVSVDITAPLYWWKEFDTYKVGTVANSTSTMHKLASTPITIDCFEMGDFNSVILKCETALEYLNDKSNDKNTLRFWECILIPFLEDLRQKYNETKDNRYWKELIRLLPESWLQTRTVTMNYENLLSMVHQRENHKLSEWSVSFIDWVKTLPYSEELLFVKKQEKE